MTNNLIRIRIIGCGCDSCERMASNVKIASELAGVKYEFSKVCDNETKMTPILFVNDKLVIYGNVMSVREIEDLLNSTGKSKQEG